MWPWQHFVVWHRTAKHRKRLMMRMNTEDAEHSAGCHQHIQRYRMHHLVEHVQQKVAPPRRKASRLHERPKLITIQRAAAISI